MEICKGLKDDGYDPTFVNARFVKPLDVDLLDELAKDHSLFVTVEENVKSGGYGEHVSAYMEACHPEVRVFHCILLTWNGGPSANENRFKCTGKSWMR